MPDSADPLPPSDSEPPQDPSAAATKPDPDMPRRKAAAGGKLKKPFTDKLRAAAEQRFAHIRGHLRLHPLDAAPARALAVEGSPHEAALRALGLLDFVQLDLPSQTPRHELIAPLVAYYDAANHRSFVRGIRVGVSRTDFTRALSLPPKPASTAPPPDVDPDAVVSAAMGFMQAYVLLPFQGDDMCILPQEVAAAEKTVKEGSAHRVDWTGLIWGLVEKEILELPNRDDEVCYYAAYLQRLILVQKPNLLSELEEEGRVEVAPEVSVDVDMNEEDGDADADFKSKSLEELELGNADSDVGNKSLEELQLGYADLRSNDMEELGSGDVDARSKSMDGLESGDADANTKSKKLEELDVADADAKCTPLDESEVGFVAVERVAVAHEVVPDNVGDAAEVMPEGIEGAVAAVNEDAGPLSDTIVMTQEDVLAVLEEEEEDAGPLSETIVATQEDVLAVPEEEEEAVGEEEDDAGPLSEMVTQEDVLAVPEEEEEAIGEEEDDAGPLSEMVTQEDVLAVPEEEEEAVEEEDDEHREEDKDATGLSLGIGSANDYDSMDVEGNANVENLDDGDSGNEEAEESEDDAYEEGRGGEEMNWRIGDDKGDGRMTHGLQRCNSNAFAGMEFENLNKGDVEMRDEVSFDDGFSGKMGSLHGMTSSNLFQAMNSIPTTYNVTDNAHDLSTGEFLAAGADAHKNGVDLGTGSFFFGNNGKRCIGDIDGYNDHMQAQEQFPQSNEQKRMRINNNSISPVSSEFDVKFSEPIQRLMSEASMLYQQKEKELQDALLAKQYLANMLQQKETYIQSLNSGRVEQQNRWQAEVRRFEHDLNVMAQLVTGHKKALKQCRATFDDYRKKFPCNKPLYVDVSGGGGLVVSVKELERKRFEEEQQKLAAANEMIEKFQDEWFSKLNGWEEAINFLWTRAEEVALQINLLKEKRKEKAATPTTEE